MAGSEYALPSNDGNNVQSSGFYGCMNRKQWLFVMMVLTICALRAFAQTGDEVTVGWDPQNCWDCSQIGIEGMYAVMIGGPVFGVIIGGLRAISRQTGGSEPELFMIRFQ